MAGLSTLATVGLIAGSVGTVAGTANAIIQGERSNTLQRRSRRDQERAQQQALAAAASEQRRASEAERAANRRSPDINELLLGELEASRRGASSTMLTGPRAQGLGAIPARKPTMLGD